jgi:hypothetical protein
MFRRLQAVLPILGLVIAVYPGWAGDRFRMPGTAYSLEMPGVPTCQNKTLVSPNGPVTWTNCAYFDGKLAQGYSLDSFVFPQAPEPVLVRQALRGAAYGAAAQSDSRVTKETERVVDGYPALDVVLVTEQNGFTAYARYVLIENHLVVATLDAGGNSVTLEEASRFLDSMRVVVPDKPREQ